MKITAEFTPEANGAISVYCPELDIASWGKTEDEAMANIREAAELQLETMREMAARGIPVQRRERTRREFEVAVDV